MFSSLWDRFYRVVKLTYVNDWKGYRRDLCHLHIDGRIRLNRESCWTLSLGYEKQRSLNRALMKVTKKCNWSRSGRQASHMEICWKGEIVVNRGQ